MVTVWSTYCLSTCVGVRNGRVHMGSWTVLAAWLGLVQLLRVRLLNADCIGFHAIRTVQV